MKAILEHIGRLARMSVLDTEVDGSNPGNSMLFPWARHFIRVASVDSAVKWVPGGDNLVKDVQCYDLFGGIALKNHAFSFIGVIIDNELNFNQYLDDMSTKATNLLNLSRRSLHMCSKEAKDSAYNMIVRPHLEYASTCWTPYTKRNLDKLEAVQHRAARFVLNFYDYHPTADLSAKFRKLYNGIHCNTVELLQICVCSIS